MNKSDIVECMANLFDYITWRGDLDFTQSPFNAVDNIIFSQFSYLPLDGIVPGPDEKGEISLSHASHILAGKLQNNQDGIRQSIMFKEDPDLLLAMGASRRYGDCRLCGYANLIDADRELQFSAVSVITGSKLCVIAYRGTDMSLVGWKEDFNMSFREAVPAQLEAAGYLEKMANNLRGGLIICGHSKGGNLAIYAASHCEKKIRKRIIAVYSNDAPGFHEKVIKSEGYAEIKGRIHSFIPQASVVGLFLEHGNDYSVVKSTQFGLLQHVLYSWEVIHDSMISCDSLTQGSRFVDKTFRDWIGSLDNRQREQFIEALYTILSASQVKSVNEIGSFWFKAAGLMIKSLKNIDDTTKAFMRKTLAALVFSARRNIPTLLKARNGEKN